MPPITSGQQYANAGNDSDQLKSSVPFLGAKDACSFCLNCKEEGCDNVCN